MTIAQRNNVIKLGIGASALLTVTSIAMFVIMLLNNLLKDYSLLVSIQPYFISRLSFFQSSMYISALQAIFFPFVSMVTLIFIFMLFEKTSAIEISYFSIFIFSISFESLRVFIPLGEFVYALPNFSIVLSKLVYFSRIFVLLTLLTSSLFAAYPFTRRSRPVIFLLIFISFSITFAEPMHTSIQLSNFLIKAGFTMYTKAVFVILGILSISNYYIHGFTAGIDEYKKTSLGVALCLVAYVLLLCSDNIIFFICFNGLFIFGLYVYLKNIHGYHLWH